MPEPSDAELLQSWAEGDQAADRTLVDRHFDVVYRFFATRAGDAAPDLVQKTFLACTAARERPRFLGAGHSGRGSNERSEQRGGSRGLGPHHRYSRTHLKAV